MKSLAKNIVDLFMRGFSLPFFLLYQVETLIIGKRKAISMVSEGISLIPGISGEWLRRSFLQWVTGLPLRDCCISFGTTFSDPRIRIGTGVYIGRRSDMGYADIGSDCVIGSGVHILSGLSQHGTVDLDTSICDQPGKYSKVTVGRGCWIGNGAIVGANIGENCVVGCGSVVIKPLPDNVVAAGNPAKVIRHRT